MAKKNATTGLMIIFIMIVISCKVNPKTKLCDKYKIISIDSIENVYVIHAKSENKYYKIVSEKEPNSQNCKKIKTGKFYNFYLTSLFKDRGKFKTNFDGVDFKGQSIFLEKDSIYDVHTAKQLRGLCFTN